MAKRWEKYCYYSGTENDLVCSWEDEMEMLLLFSLLSHVQLCDPMPGFFVLCYLLDLFKFISTESVILPNHLILCHPLLLLPSIFPSIRVFSNESVLHIRWPKYWSFSFSISPSKEDLRLIYFRIDWFALLAVQGTLNSLLQHYNLKASILQCSAFFTVHLSHPRMTIGKTITLTT